MINWIKSHLLSLALIIIIVYLLVPKTSVSRSTINSFSGAKMMTSVAEIAPVSDVSNRLVIQDTNLSLVVKDVGKEINNIESKAKDLGGYLVNSSLSKPESAASGNITVRVPESKRAEALSAFKGYAVKVVSESVYGVDVTDEYVDLDSRLAILDQTKIKYEQILNQAVAVADLMNVQRELINLQSQIDSLKGQQKYYEQSAKLSKIVVNLSTDELALPYAPTNEWRPAVIFKTAVRSLVGTFRSVGSLIIWALVYSPILILIYFGYRLVRSRK